MRFGGSTADARCLFSLTDPGPGVTITRDRATLTISGAESSIASPVLAVQRRGDKVILSWSGTGDNCFLEETATGKNSWAPVSAPVQVSGGRFRVTQPACEVQLYYRLRLGAS
jgi:hypothetical protein